MLADLQGVLSTLFQRTDPVVDDPSIVSTCEKHVAGNERVSPAEQVDIYRRQFWLRHIDCLIEDYPALRYVLGEEAFEAFCHGYLAAYPPKTPSLRDLGADIPAFAEQYEGFSVDRKSLAIDLARYENAFVDIFDAKDEAPLDPQKVTSLPPEAWATARIVLHPHLVRMTVRHAVHTLRYELKAGEKPNVEALAAALDPPIHLALFRRDDVVHYQPLAPEAFAILEAMGRGASLVAACEEAARGLDAEAAAALEPRVGSWFQEWTAAGFLVDIVP